MKKSIYFILPLILISSSILSQNNTLPFSKIETALYNIQQDGSEELSYELREIFEYDKNGNLIVEEQKRYNYQGELYSQRAYRNEYDVLGNKIKSVLHTYNPDVDLWIAQNYYNLSYDDNNCMLEEIQTENIIANLKRIEKKYVNDNNCRKLEEEYKYYGLTGELGIYNKSFFEYLNNQVSFIKKSHFTLNNSGSYESRVDEFTYNEYGDLIHQLKYYVVSDTSLSREYIHTFIYDFSDKGLMKSKNREMIKIIFFSNGTTDSMHQISERITYEYDCQGNVIKEIRATQTYNPLGFVNFDEKTYISYFYVGENDCFDHKENLELTIFPNPTSEFIKISSPIFGSGDTNVRITDLTGRVIFDELVTSRVPEFYVDLKKLNLPTGIFIVQLKSDKYQIGEKILFAE